MTQTSSTARLLVLWCHGDTDAKERLGRIYLTISETIARQISSRRGLDTEDVLDAAMIKSPEIFRAIRKTKPKRVEAYFATAVRRAMEDAIWTLKKRLLREKSFTSLGYAPSGVTLPDLTWETMEEVLASCNSEIERQIVCLRAERHTEADVSNMLGVPSATVHLRLMQIKARYYARQRSYLDRSTSYALAT